MLSQDIAEKIKRLKKAKLGTLKFVNISIDGQIEPAVNDDDVIHIKLSNLQSAAEEVLNKNDIIFVYTSSKYGRLGFIAKHILKNLGYFYVFECEDNIDQGVF